LEHFKKIVSLYEEVKHHTLLEETLEKKITLNVGLNIYAKALFYNDIVPDFKKMFPNISFLPTTINDSLSLLHTLLNRELDFVISMYPPYL